MKTIIKSMALVGLLLAGVQDAQASLFARVYFSDRQNLISFARFPRREAIESDGQRNTVKKEKKSAWYLENLASNEYYNKFCKTIVTNLVADCWAGKRRPWFM